jgi:phage repressor protein C with HTH and peptisase S24 domain
MLDAPTMKRRLNDAFVAIPLRNIDVATACGVTPQAVGGWRRTGRIDKKHLETLAKLTHRPLTYWLGDDAPAAKMYKITTGSSVQGIVESPLMPTESRAYVRYEVMGSGGAGPGVINTDYPEVLREIEVAEWRLYDAFGRLPSPVRVKLLTVRGDSMSPKIRNGDVVFVDTEDTAYDGDGTYVVVIHRHTLVKRLELRTDGLHIVSLSAPDRPDIVAPDAIESLRIAGRVIGTLQLRRAEDL